MKNCYKDTLNKVFEIRDKSVDQTKKFEYSDYILRNGKVIYVYKGFNFDALASAVKLHLFNELNQVTDSIKISENIIQISYSSKEGIAEKLNVGERYKVLMMLNEDLLYINIDLADATDKPEEKRSMITFSSLLNDSYKKELFIFIYHSVYDTYIGKFPQKKLNFENTYIEETHLNERMFIHNICENELVLAKLNISSLTNDRIDLADSENASFVLTDQNACIAVFNKAGESIFFEVLDSNFKITKRIGKNAMKFGGTTWYPKRSNSRFFEDLSGIFAYTGNERMKELARLNYLKEEFKTAENLLLMIKDSDNDPVDNLCLLFVKSKQEQNSEDAYYTNENLQKHTDEILRVEDAELKILEAFELWNIDYNKKTLFLNLFANLADTPEEREKLLPLWESVREEFLKKNKDTINQSVFDITYAEFLISAEHKRKAAKLLNKLEEKLPDETTSDLLPMRTMNLAGDKSGQLLRISVLDLYAKAKGKESSSEEVQKGVQLQPLNKDRLSTLAAVKDKRLNEKAVQIITIMNENGLVQDDNLQDIPSFKAANEKTLINLRHPATLKTGSFYSIQKWTSKVKTDDYAALKNYSEKINGQNHQELFKLIENVRTLYNIPKAEYYISMGERNNNIIGYEGDPPFMIFGHEHLNKNSNLYLNEQEVLFSVAVEFAHIYFKHSKITSQDVWRGVTEKGYFVIDTLLSAIPAAGLIAKSLQNVPRLSKLALIIRSTDKILSGSKNIYDASMRLTDFYQKKFKTNSKEEKEQKLLAASRLMQFTADRAGLCISGDLKAAVRSVFLTSKYNFELFEEAKKTSLESLLLKTNNDGSYKYQELALRLANMFSFFVSDDYDLLRKKLVK